jgi:exosortase
MSNAAAPALPRATSTGLAWKLLFGAVILAHAPLIGLHLHQAWVKEYYQYMPLVPVGAWILAARRFRESFGEPDFGFGTQFMAALGLFLLGASVLFYSPWLSVFSFIINLGVAARLVGGLELARAIRPGTLFLLLMLPLPLDSDVELLQWLQRATVKGSGAVYEWSGHYCMIVGAVVQLPDLPEPLFVADACSGIQSLFAVLTCTIFYLVWSGRGFIHSMLVLVSALGWVMAANISRILAVMYFTKPGVLDLSKGMPHELLGMLTFVSALLLTLSTDRLFLVFNPPRELPEIEDEEAPETTPARRRKHWTAAGAFAILVAAAGVFSAGKVFLSARQTSSPFTFKFDVPELPSSHLPSTLGDWRLVRSDGVIRRADDDHMAAQSQQWRFSNGFQNAVVSLDYPYPSTHDLQGCYENIGWTLAARDLLDVPAAFAPPFGDFVRLRLQKGTDEYAYVAFTAFTMSGEPETLGRMRIVDALSDRFGSVVKRLTNSGQGKIRLRQPIYQMQVVSESPLPLTPAQVKQLDDLFLAARKNFAPPKFTLNAP